jgi:putative glutamine amidotransferase
VARPLIGITTYVTPAKWSYWELEAALIPVDYVRAVERAGGRALLVPPSEGGVEETLQALDGLVFSGGSDLDPELYDQEPHDQTFGIHEERDRAELALLKAALQRDMPVLAICRGSQVLNVARGGDLVQHLPDVVGD